MHLADPAPIAFPVPRPFVGYDNSIGIGRNKVSPRSDRNQINDWTGGTAGETLADAAGKPSKLGPRQLACARCGATFACNVGGPCWCGQVEVKFPLPKPGEPNPTGFDDCLCRDCLQAVADEHAKTQRAEAGRAT
jgi:hypothetical protein